MKGLLRRFRIGLLLLPILSLSVPQAAWAGSDRIAAMWLSIARPGLGEWYLKDWGSFGRCPQNKFWLGLIPLYGWPGYLQVKSAIDAKHGRTNDDLTFRE